MANQTYLVSPELRLVSGDPFNPQKLDKMGNQKTVKNGPNAGQPTQDYPLSGAIAKTDPAAMPFLMSIMQVAASAKPAFFPNGVQTPAPNAGPMEADDVAKAFGCNRKYWCKIQDGDGFDGDGKPNNVKEGHAGHWIIKLSQPSAPKVYEAGKYAEMERVDIDPGKHSLFKRGYYFRVNIAAQDSGIDAQPGMFLNPQMIEITRAGTEITSGPDAFSVFGGAPAPAAAAPPAPSAPAPAAPAGLVATGKDGQTIEGLRAAGWSDDQMVAGGYATRPLPATPPAAPPAPTPPAAPPAPTAATPSPSNVQPYGGYMQTGGAPTPPADTGGAPAGFKMLPAAQGATYQMMLANGWNDDLLKSNGMMGPL